MFEARFEVLPHIDSTNAEIMRRAARGAPEGLWLRAARQGAGRGRRGRAWSARDGDLLASVLLRPGDARPLDPGEAATLSFVAALSVHDALCALGAGDDAQLKWPNDVLLRGRKVSGLLLEAEGPPTRPDIALGLGVNLAPFPPETVLESAAAPAIGLADVGVWVRPDEMLSAVAAAFGARYEAWTRDGFAGVRSAWMARAIGRGAPLVARLPDRSVSGVFIDVDGDGALVLDGVAGRERIFAADVYFPLRAPIGSGETPEAGDIQ